MTITELLERIQQKADDLGIDLESMGMYDDEDIQVRALTFFLNNMEDLDDEMVTVDSDDEIESDYFEDEI